MKPNQLLGSTPSYCVRCQLTWYKWSTSSEISGCPDHPRLQRRKFTRGRQKNKVKNQWMLPGLPHLCPHTAPGLQRPLNRPRTHQVGLATQRPWRGWGEKAAILIRTVRLRSFGRHGLMFKILIANVKLINTIRVHEKAKNNILWANNIFPWLMWWMSW